MTTKPTYNLSTEDKAIFGRHNEGCTCPVCTRVEKWYDEYRSDCMPERSRELRFS